MARLTLFCVVVCAVVAVTCAQLTGQGMGPLGGGGGGGGATGGGMNNMQGYNPWNFLLYSRFLDMNPFLAWMLGMGGGNMMNNLLPLIWFRNW